MGYFINLIYDYILFLVRFNTNLINKLLQLKEMDILLNFHKIVWCKPDWCFQSMNKETKVLLLHCADSYKLKMTDDVMELIKRSKQFPIPFPIDSVRLEKLKETRPIERLKENITSTYPIIHERVLLLLTHFLVYKREFGTSIEKQLYKDMQVPDLIDRILKKRAAMFVGPRDLYKLLSGEKGSEGWESIGTEQEKPPLVLKNCLSYDEMKLSAMVFVSGHTECINDGTRKNSGKVRDDIAEENAVIIGLIGPRFQRRFRLDYEDMLITPEQNQSENGYGKDIATTVHIKDNQTPKIMWRKMWNDFYQVPSYTYDELKSSVTVRDVSEEKRYRDRYVTLLHDKDVIFDNEVYYKRLTILADCALAEAERRASDAGRDAFLNIIGCGLGVWQISPHQIDVYVLVFLERIKSFLEKEMLNHVTDVNISYIKPSKGILSLFNNRRTNSNKMKIFFESEKHPKGGINVYLENREPSTKLRGEHAGKLLVLTYPWDGNAHPGNEFWKGSLTSSGDPAAACSTQVAELHNAHINPVVCGHNTRVVGRYGVKTLPEYINAMTELTTI